MEKQLIATLQQMGIDGAEEKARTLLSYMEIILQKNQAVNLTAITQREEFISKHILDSLACARLEIFLQGEQIIDIGTGGGFPGIPLAVAFPEKEFTLVDSLNKRIRIVQDACDTLGITNITALHGRAEELGRQPELRDRFDLCVSRAVARLSVLTELCMPFVRTDGFFLAYKGADCAREVEEAAKAIQSLGGELTEVVSQPESQGMENHNLVLIRKLHSTPDRFPRKPGKAAKEPLEWK